jgi:hypothetical protein
MTVRTGTGRSVQVQFQLRRITATVLDLEREMPKIRDFVLQRWKAAIAAPKDTNHVGLPVGR